MSDDFEHGLYTDKLATCIGKPTCLLEGIHNEVSLGNQGGANSDCTLDEKSYLFVQYLCQVKDEELTEKRNQALLASCACVFSALVLLSVLKYRSGSIDVEKRLWDLQTVTASDYTLEIKLYPD